MYKAKEFKPGQRLHARDLQALALEVERLGKVDCQSPLVLREDGGGLSFHADVGGDWWIRITGGGGSSAAYSWTRVVGDPGTPGGWINSPGGETGTTATGGDPAYEANGNTAAPTNVVVPAWREETTGDLRFQAASC